MVVLEAILPHSLVLINHIATLLNQAVVGHDVDLHIMH